LHGALATAMLGDAEPERMTVRNLMAGSRVADLPGEVCTGRPDPAVSGDRVAT